MKRKTARKLAKRYLRGIVDCDDGFSFRNIVIPDELTRFIWRVEEYPAGLGYWKTEVHFNPRLDLAIRRLAQERGWDGCHWTNPLVVNVVNVDCEF